RPGARQAVGARADHDGLRPQRRTADRREAGVPRGQAGTQRAPVLHPRPGGRAGAAGARRPRPLRHHPRNRRPAGQGAGLMQPYCDRARAPAERARLAGAWPWAALLAIAFALLPFPAPAAATRAEEAATPSGQVVVEEELRDPDFGVTTRRAGLQRHVEMYQWTRDGNGYALEWRGARVDSSGFAPGHENPRQIPLREREWRAP